ncbi:MBL fold metallo-hydrolase [Haloferula sp. A504]|uniref:MBL fold metallo-hydrolase n=1 Tax=Haloferula sp. A504 TaxID=3373601 RepID=UPI0031C915AB|nr:MBL fold metallo-hydrolase [Verrucomicrobiaceae bacterium E54]
MIRPVLQDEALLADVANASPDQVHIWWLGQSGFLVRHGATHFVFDPYLSDTLTEKYAATDKPHVRMTERVLDPAKLDFVSFATSTHAHTDHLDHGTLRPMREVNRDLKLVLPRAITAMAAERLGDWGGNFLPMNAGEAMEQVKGLRIEAVPAAHNELDRDGNGNHLYLGYVVTVGEKRIYHSGDTLLYPGMEEAIGTPVDVALLPINGNKPERRVSGNLDGREAAELARRLGAGVVVPCHYEMFEFNTASPELFETTCRELGQTCRVLRAGERLTI